jgi:hypothetical protein
VRTELVLKGILPANHSFQGGDRLCLLPLGLFSSVEETHVSLQRKPTMLETAASSTFFPLRIKYDFKRNTSRNLGV